MRARQGYEPQGGGAYEWVCVFTCMSFCLCVYFDRTA